VKNKILFRADGNSHIGLGHLYRLYALSEVLGSTYGKIFLSKDTDFTKKNFKGIDEHYPIPSNLAIEDEPDWIGSVFSSTECIIITDGYCFNEEYQKKIKVNKFTLVCVDDLASSYMYADLVINHSISIGENNYSSEPYTRYALGTGYALLRSLFLEAATKSRIIKHVKNVFICFGGADPYDLTLQATKAILKNDYIVKVNVVVGDGYVHRPIHKLKDERLNIHYNLNEVSMLKTMLASDAAIAPASTISYELCSARILLYCGYYTDNQALIYQGMLDKGLIIGCGDFNTFNFDSINLRDGLEMVRGLIDRQELYFDGDTSRRVNSLMLKYA
jgi:UDP-2,4-diacetamido-2,4,6-trideoxy-beta-L-altropyranose hydrolase